MMSTQNVSLLRLSDEPRGEIRRTEWDLELWGELHRLADLDYAACGRVVEEALEMQHENGR